MGYGTRDPYSDYMSGNTYEGGAPALPMQAAGAALPYVQAGMSGLGLLSSLYGGYEANKQARRNFNLQKEIFDEDRQQANDDRRRKHGQEDLANMYDAAGRADQGENGRLAKYLNYFRQIGQ